MKSCGLILTVVVLLALAGCGGGGMTTQTHSYAISAAVSGLTGTLVLQDNLGDQLTFNSNATQIFTTSYGSGATYTVSIMTQPALQTCTLSSNATGSVNANVTVAVTCAATTYTISATVAGLSGGSLVLQDDQSDQLTFTGNTTQAFAKPYTTGSNYTVSILAQPAGLTCILSSNATGTITSNITVTATCAATVYTISASVAGLSSGTLKLQDNVGDSLTFTSNNTQTFATAYVIGSSYTVTVATQPAGLTCTLSSNASGTITSNITVTATCVATTFTLSASVSGLSTGTLMLADNLGDALSFTGNTTQTFTTPYTSGSTYSVSITTQPAGENCTLGSNSSGTITSNITVAVTCAASFTIGGTVNGYATNATGLQLQNTINSDTVTVNNQGSSSPFTFSIAVPTGTSYNVVVLTQPSNPISQTCTVTSGGSGTVSNANVTNVVVTCTTNSYTIGGNVTGLTGSGLQLQDNNTDTLTINASGPFTFATKILSGSTYSVTVSTQPSGQSCTVTAFASGTVTNANITSVAVTCGAITTHNIWTWQNGTNTTDQAGIYPTSKPGPGTPGSREGAVTWTDLSGNLWLFGGLGYDHLGNLDYLNDLWEYSPSANTWTWVAGSNSINQNGSYVSPFIPGARAWATGWTDLSGNLWLFGGYGEDSVLDNPAGAMNDLWEFTGGAWNYIMGSQTVVMPPPLPTYGAKGVKGVSGNIPGGRYYASASVDSSGNFWLFGGFAFDNNGNQEAINDLWEFSGGDWTWISGAETVDQKPTYGNGTFANANIPGARVGSTMWIDSSGNIYLFGGDGIDSQNNTGALNDLWEFNGSQWAWLSGGTTNVIDQAGVYVTQGSAGTPGSRFFTSGWIDKSNNLWLFGGEGIGSAEFNDLWEFTNGGWIWMNGADVDNQFGTYGTEGPGGGSSTTTPGAREFSVSWVDNSGNLWLFGGFGFATENPPDHLNDLWEYQP